MVAQKRALIDPEEEEAFPRGGGDVISALERKQIEVEAEADFAREGGAGARTKKRKKEDKGAVADSLYRQLKGSSKSPTFVELLKFKNVDEGCKMLGCIVEVSSRELVVGLPHGLRGHVMPQQASDVFLDHPPALPSLFRVGQLVRCTVIGVQHGTADGSEARPVAAAGKKGQPQRQRKRLDLSLHVSHVNEGMSIGSLSGGMVLPGAVSSEEDHGYRITFGIKGVTGFLRHSASVGKLRVGELVDCVVEWVNTDRRLVRVKMQGGAIGAAVTKEWDGLTLGSLVPGSCVNCKVKALMGDGLMMAFMGVFNGTVDKFHTTTPLPAADWLSEYHINQRVRAVVLFVNPVSKVVGLSMAPHLMAGHPNAVIMQQHKELVGQVMEGAVVKRVDPGLGLLVEMVVGEQKETLAGYAHISEVSDEKVENLAKMFKAGKRVSVRVIGWRPMEGMAVVSLRSSVLSQRILSHADLEVGSMVEGKVMAVEEPGMSIAITNTLRAFVPAIHLGSTSLHVAQKKYKVGSIVKARVWEVNPEKRRLFCTLKKSLMDTKLPIITNIKDVKIDMKSHGIVTGVQEYGVFVQFFGGVCGMAHASELGLATGQAPQDCYKLGQSVRCRVLSVDPLHRRLRLSVSSKTALKGSTTDNNADHTGGQHGTTDAGDVDNDDHMGGLHPGDMVSGTVLEVHVSKDDGSDEVAGHYILSVSGADGGAVVRGRLDVSHSSDHPAAVSMWAHVLQVGHHISGLMVLERMEGISTVRVTRKSSLIRSVSSLPSSVSDVLEGSVIPGYVCSMTQDSVFVRFLGNITGRAGVSHLSDGRARSPQQCYRVGQSVRAQVVSVQSGKFTVTLKPSLTASSDAEYLHTLFRDMEAIEKLDTTAEKPSTSAVNWDVDFRIGSIVDGVVRGVKDYGVVCDMKAHEDVVGLVPTGQLTGKRSPKTGTPVRGVVLDLSKYHGLLDISCRTQLIKQVEERETKKKKKSKLKSGSVVECVIELVKEDYWVLSLPNYGSAIAFASPRDFNTAALPQTTQYKQGSVVRGTVWHVPDGSCDDRMMVHLLFTMISNNDLDADMDNDVSGAGTVEHVVVTAVHPLQLDVKTAAGVGGRIHITQMPSPQGDMMENPLHSIKVGDSLRAVVLGGVCTASGQKHKVREMSARPALVAAAEAGEKLPAVNLKLSDISIGQQLQGFVQEVHNDHLWVTVSPAVRGRVYILDAMDDVSNVKQLQRSFRIGQPVTGTVLQVSSARHSLDLTLRAGVVCGSTGPFNPGDILIGQVMDKSAGDVKIRISPVWYGKASLCDIHDVWVNNALEQLHDNAFVRCQVLSVDESNHVALSLRPSKGGQWVGTGVTNAGRGPAPHRVKVQDLKAGQQVVGYVKSVGRAGAFVSLSRDVVARVKLSNLSDVFVENPAEAFPLGKCVSGTVVAVDQDRVEISLRSGRNRIQRLDDIIPGKVYRGTVKRVEKYGLFVELRDATAVGLVHISEVAHEFVKDLHAMFKAGQAVTVKALSVDIAAHRLSLTMRLTVEDQEAAASVEGEQYQPHDSDDESLDIEQTMLKQIEEQENVDHMVVDLEDETEGEEEEEEEGSLSGDDHMADTKAQPHIHDDDDDDDDVDDDDVGMLEDDESGEEGHGVRQGAAGVGMALDVGDEGWETLKLEDEQHKQDKEQAVIKEGTQLSRKAAKRLAEQREKEVRERELKRMDGEQAPATQADFESLVLTSPNSSYAWVKYAAFLISLGDIPKARQVLDRALTSINYRETGEKFNVWLAYLNLENVYGDPPEESLMKLFQRALQYNDQKKLYMDMMGILERSERHTLAEQMLKTMCKKFSGSAKVWLRHIEYLMARGDAEAARKLLDRSLTSLPKRKHIKVISRSALLEYRIGNPERGRSIFEAILRNYPKRLDVWSTYIDQEIKLGDVSRIRGLFERSITLQLPAKKMKFFFKRYLEYESSVGDERKVEYVKQRAQEYVDHHVNS